MSYPFAAALSVILATILRVVWKSCPDLAFDGEQIPQMKIGIYDWAVIVDHRKQQSWLVSHGKNAQTHENWQTLCALFDAPETQIHNEFRLTSDVISNMDLPAYTAAFNKIQRYIDAGDCYQVNLAQRFAAKAEGDTWALTCNCVASAPHLSWPT